MNCPIYDLECKNYTGVSLHFRSEHGTADQLFELLRQKYVDENYNGVIPTCACGCGNVPRYYNHKEGYVKFLPGHQSRVNNNWGHNKGALTKSQDIRREMHKRGEIKIWNKGETKETDERITELGRKQSENITPERRIAMSARMSNNRLAGIIPTLYGKDHPRWKGGSSSLQQLTRSHLYRVWSLPKMIQTNFMCQICSSTKDLAVHHDGERFAIILQKAMQHFNVQDATQLNFEQKYELSIWIVDYHLNNDVSGIVLCESCHTIAHRSFITWRINT